MLQDIKTYNPSENGIWEIFKDAVAIDNHLATVEGTFRATKEYASSLVDEDASTVIVKLDGNIINLEEYVHEQVNLLEEEEKNLLDQLSKVREKLSKLKERE